MSEAITRTAHGAEQALVVEDFVPPEVTSEMVGLLTPWPPPIYHDRPSLPRLTIGALCRVKACQPTVSRWPSRQPASVRYEPSGLCVACYARLQRAWKRKQQQGDPDERT